MQADLETAFELLKIQSLDLETLDDESKINIVKSSLEQVKHGINLKFDILYALTENLKEDLKNQFVQIPNSRYGVRYGLAEYLEELDNRKAVAKRALLKVNEKDTFYKSNQ